MNIRPNSYAAWMVCCRPKTWMIAVSPVILGLAFSFWHTHHIHGILALATALLAVLMQAISNMENDAAYTRRNAERSNRKGLPRATANGWLTVGSVERAIVLLLGVVCLDTAYLIYEGGWIMLIISTTSAIAAYVYMGSAKPLAYTPWSELVCFVFFGVVAVCGTFYLQTKTLSTDVVLASFCAGFLSSAVLVVNNYRDIEHDRSIGRKTLAILLGKQNTEYLYLACLLLPFLCTALMTAYQFNLWPVLCTWVFTARALDLFQALKTQEGDALNAVLFSTAKLEMLFALLLSFILFGLGLS